MAAPAIPPSVLTSTAISAAGGALSTELARYPRRVICVGTRAGINGAGQSNGTNLQFNTQTNHYLPIACTDVRLVYENFFVQQGQAEADQTLDITLKVGARPSGAAPGKTQPDAPTIATARRVIFGGAVSGGLIGSTSAVSGSTNLISEVLPYYFPGNSALSVATYAVLASGQYWRGRPVVTGPGERNEEGVTVTDRSIAGGAAGTGSWTIGPNLIIGVPVNPSARAVAIIGDSITDGTGDTASATTGVIGWVERGLGIDVPNAKFTRSGAKLSHLITRNYSQFDLIGRYFTDAILEPITNDVEVPDSLATIQANYATLVAKLQGMGVRVKVPTPPPFTTGAWTLPDGSDQTVSANQTVRTAVQSWLLAGGLVAVADVIDMRPYWEMTGQTGKWKAGYTNDGVHPNATGHLAAAAAMPPSLFGY